MRRSKRKAKQAEKDSHDFGGDKRGYIADSMKFRSPIYDVHVKILSYRLDRRSGQDILVSSLT